MMIDELKPTNSFELGLLELLKSGAPLHVEGHAPAIHDEVVQAIGMMADRISALAKEVADLRTIVAVHEANFTKIRGLAG